MVTTMTPERNLMDASRQWAFRPDDERFWTLEEMIEKTRQYREDSEIHKISSGDLAVQPVGGGDLVLATPQGEVGFTHYSFRQFCQSLRQRIPGTNPVRTVSPNPEYLATLPAEKAAELLNYGLEKQKVKDVSMMLRNEGRPTLRCFTSPEYGRIWNHELGERVLALGPHWRTPPARPVDAPGPRSRQATAADITNTNDHAGGWQVKIGDWIDPAGIYASDKDCFIFRVDESKRIDDGTPGGLARGFFVENSEVGERKFRMTFFLYRFVCGNHIVWQAKNVITIEVRHLGERARVQAFEGMQKAALEYTNSSAEREERAIKAARKKQLGVGKDEVVDLVYNRGILTKKFAEAAYDAAEKHENDPTSVWGFVQGVTRLSQESHYADVRTSLDRSATRLLALSN